MRRRRFLAGTAALAVAGPALADELPVPAGNQMSFRVLRNGTPIGEHHLNFIRGSDGLVVDINIALLVTFAGIPLFRYGATAREHWSGGVFQSLESQVNDNGARLAVHAHKTAAGYSVAGINHDNPARSYPEYTAPADTMPLTYWNKAMLNGTLLNIQTAHTYAAVVKPQGWNSLPTAEGGVITAQRFDLRGKLHLNVWYDRFSQWSGLAFHVSGNESYEKITT
ncbi:DUF6134 family protein [Acidocella sp.]|uniref:DUF6134 family protein n=1 Tax=Acidocella sp. TaxID=50710 RepID=UPI0026214519|nr:DUF6134 family protein [Acidocella sp.]MDD2795261.1 DUF6134 family protein [Acidocella sp.]